MAIAYTAVTECAGKCTASSIHLEEKEGIALIVMDGLISV